MSGTQSGEQSERVAAPDGKGPSPNPMDRIGDPETMLDRLQGLLEKQLELVHQGNLAAAAELCEQADQYVQAITGNRGRASPLAGDRRAGTHNRTAPGSVDQWQRIERLYKDLCLALAAQRTETSDALSTIRQGKRVLRTYGNHLFSR